MRRLGLRFCPISERCIKAATRQQLRPRHPGRNVVILPKMGPRGAPVFLKKQDKPKQPWEIPRQLRNQKSLNCFSCKSPSPDSIGIPRRRICAAFAVKKQPWLFETALVVSVFLSVLFLSVFLEGNLLSALSLQTLQNSTNLSS